MLADKKWKFAILNKTKLLRGIKQIETDLFAIRNALKEEKSEILKEKKFEEKPLNSHVRLFGKLWVDTKNVLKINLKNYLVGR